MNNGSFLVVGDVSNDEGLIKTSLDKKKSSKEFILFFLEWLSCNYNKLELEVYESSKHYNNGEIVFAKYSDVTILECINYENIGNENDLDDYSYCEFVADLFNPEKETWQCLPFKIDWLDTEYSLNFNMFSNEMCTAILYLTSNDIRKTIVFKAN